MMESGPLRGIWVSVSVNWAPPSAAACTLPRKSGASHKLKAKLESTLSYDSFKRLVPGALNGDLIGSTCAALPRSPPWRTSAAGPPCFVMVGLKCGPMDAHPGAWPGATRIAHWVE